MPFRLSRQQLLTDLFAAYQAARKHKRKTADQQAFELHLERELTTLCDELCAAAYKPQACMCFMILDPKPREVFAAPFRDRVVHHLFYAYTHRLFESTFIADPYSCIEGRGTHYGVGRLAHHIRSVSRNYTRPCHVLKLDIKGYFMHIDRRLLLGIALRALEKKRHDKSVAGRGEAWEDVVDYPLVEYLLETFVMQDATLGCRRKGRPGDWKQLPPSRSLFHSPVGCGLPIGNLTSQLFSNIYLNEFDQYMKRTLGCRHYGRYVDDSFVVGADRRWLAALVPQVEQYLRSALHLQLHKGKVHLVPARMGVEFLGVFVKPWRNYASHSCVARLKRGISRIRVSPEADPSRLCASLSSYAGVLSHVAGYDWRRKLLCGNRRVFQVGSYSNCLRKFEISQGVKSEYRGRLEQLLS